MKTNDQWFEPGDKVMRVATSSEAVGDIRGHWWYEKDDAPKSGPQFGRVYCVEDFWEGPRFNVVMLVGFGGWRYHGSFKVGWAASCFRKVEEIKLCVEAVKKSKERTLTPNKP